VIALPVSLKQADVSEQRRRKQGFPGPFANATRSGAFRSLVQRSTLFYFPASSIARRFFR